MAARARRWAVGAGLVMATCLASAQPLPQISANGGQGQVIALPGMSVDIAVALQAGAAGGRAGDWWLAAEVGGIVHVYSFTQGWTTGLAPTLQAPLVDVPWLRVLTMPAVPAGRYALYFAVDTRMDGALDSDLHFGQVTLTVPDWNCVPAGRDSRASLSPVQQQFIAARGNPRLFTLSFLGELLDDSGRQGVASAPRRLETWVFDRGGLVSSQFDNGHFVGETSHGGAGLAWPATHLGPGQFSACMTRAHVVALMGEPSCTIEGAFGGRQLQYLRYRPTSTRSAATIVLENGVLSTVMAGYSFAAAGSTSADLCKQP